MFLPIGWYFAWCWLKPATRWCGTLNLQMTRGDVVKSWPTPEAKEQAEVFQQARRKDSFWKPPVGVFANRWFSKRFQETRSFQAPFRQPFAIHLTISYNVMDWEQGTKHSKSIQSYLVEFVCVCGSELDMFLGYFRGWSWMIMDDHGWSWMIMDDHGWSFKDPRHAGISKKSCRGSDIDGLKPSRTLIFSYWSVECAGLASFVPSQSVTIHRAGSVESRGKAEKSWGTGAVGHGVNQSYPDDLALLLRGLYGGFLK